MRRSLTLLVFIISWRCSAQLVPGLSINGYADAYLAYYTDSLPAGAFQKFPTYAPRSNSIGLNIAQLGAVYKADRVRATITLHYGDIPASSWSPTFNMIQEANAGIRIGKGLWIDGGFFRTHIGAEGIYPKENITSSLSVVTFFEPLYEAGLKLTYQITPKLEGRLYLLNGFGIYEENNKKKSLGLLLTYTLNDYSSLVYSNYFGDDMPDGTAESHKRFFNNFCYFYDRKKLRLTVGLDFATQQGGGIHLNSNGEGHGTMFGGMLAARYKFHPRFNIYARSDMFNDDDAAFAGPIQMPQGPVGLKTMSGTIGFEYKPLDNAYIRLEGRTIKVSDDVKPFYWDGEFKDQRYDAIFSLGAWF